MCLHNYNQKVIDIISKDKLRTPRDHLPEDLHENPAKTKINLNSNVGHKNMCAKYKV